MSEINKRQGRNKQRSTFAILFYINRTKARKDGSCQLLCRLTIDTDVAQIGTKVTVDPSVWDGKAGRTIGKSKRALEVNQAIKVLSDKITDHYHQIQESLGFVNAEMIKNALLGVNQKQITLVKLFKEHNEEYEKRIGVDRVRESLYGYIRTLELLRLFLEEKYEQEDISLRSLNLTFIDAFDLYLRSERLLGQHSISNHLIYLKKMTRRAVSQGTLKRDPFSTFIPEQPERKCRHLTAEELERLMSIHIDEDNIRHTRDMFVFSTFTGLAYSDLYNLSEEHLKAESDGSLWIHIKRQKTKTACCIRLLELPLKIMDKYKNERV